jgi:hypothetical protein
MGDPTEHTNWPDRISSSELGPTINFGPLEFPIVLLPDRRIDFAVRGRRSRLEERVMFVALAVLLLLAWALGFAVFHVSGGLIHLLIILAVISVIVHFARGRSAV